MHEVLGHRAVRLDADGREVELDDGTVLHGRRHRAWPPGRRPGRLPGTEALGQPTACSRCAPSTTRWPCAPRVTAMEARRVVVIGAGFIGAEVASTCAGLGCRVTVLEAHGDPAAQRPRARASGRTAARCTPRTVCDLRTGVGVAGSPPDADGRDGGRLGGRAAPAARRSTADVVVVGIGVVPSTEWLDGSGLTIENGVVCDDRLFAADGIVAAGDVARWNWRHDGAEEQIRIEHWQVAAEAGVAAARSLLAGRADAPRPSLRSRTSGRTSTASDSRCWATRAAPTRSRSSTGRSKRASSSRCSAGPVACVPSWPSASRAS